MYTASQTLSLTEADDNDLLTATKVSFDADLYSRDENGNVTFIAANDSQLMDKDGNEVAANGLYSYFDEDGNYKGGLYKYADSEDPSIKNLTEMSAGEVALFVEQGEKETGALTLTLHVGADATKNNQISVDIDAMSASSLGVENLKVTGKDDTNALNAIETIKAALQQLNHRFVIQIWLQKWLSTLIITFLHRQVSLCLHRLIRLTRVYYHYLANSKQSSKLILLLTGRESELLRFPFYQEPFQAITCP